MSGGVIVHQTNMLAEYSNLSNYLKTRFPGCQTKVMYEAVFSGFWLHDLLVNEGIDCVVTPPNNVTQEKVNKVKTDSNLKQVSRDSRWRNDTTLLPRD